MLIFAPATLCQILARKYKELGIRKKIYLNTIEAAPLITDSNIEYCRLVTLQDCKDFVVQKKIELVVVLTIALTKEGLVNFFKYNLNLPVIGVTKDWMKLESSKLFGKKFMQKYNIKTPDYIELKELKDIEEAIRKFDLPLVIKDDGLCAGLGTHICDSKENCIKIFENIISKNRKCLAERYIKGEEITLHLIWDGKNITPLEPVRDYKRLKDNNKGINTGSMGCYCPVKLSNEKLKLIDVYVERLNNIFQKIKPDFKGIFVSGLMLTENSLYTLEFNMRPGLPEFDVLTVHLQNNIFNLFSKIEQSNLSKNDLIYKKGITGCVNAVYKDYELYTDNPQNKIISLDRNDLLLYKDNLYINTFINEFSENNKAIINPHNPVLSIIKNDINNPFEDIYQYLTKLGNKDLYYRKDIGKIS